MTLPAAFPLSVSQINVELNRAGGAAFDIQGVAERALAQVPSGAIAFSDFLGKSSRSVTLVHTSTSDSEVANYGPDFTGRDIVIIALGGNDTSPYTLGATIGGVGGNTIIFHSTGSGAGAATGTAIIVGQPAGTSGTVTITGAVAVKRFYVLSVSGYDMSSAVFAQNSSGGGIPPWGANIPTNGFCLSVCQSSNTGPSPLNWSGLTERIADASLMAAHISSVAWDINMASNPSKSIDVTASDGNGDTSAVIATFNPS